MGSSYMVFYNLTLVVNAQPLWQSMNRPGVDAEYSIYHARNMFEHAHFAKQISADIKAGLSTMTALCRTTMS